MQAQTKPSNGFTLIELMIVIAIIALLLAIALPAYQDYSIRAKVGEAYSVGAGAKIALAESCQSDTNLTVNDGSDIGYAFAPSKYVQSVEVAADCISGAMAIGIQTRNTGAEFDPIILLTTNGLFFLTASGGGNLSWNCLGLAEKGAHLPSGCRITEEDFYGDLQGIGDDIAL